MTDYQLIFWYALEIERRQCEYARLVRAAGGAVCDVTANDLRDFQRFVDIIKNLSLLSSDVRCDTLLSQHAANCAISWNKNFIRSGSTVAILMPKKNKCGRPYLPQIGSCSLLSNGDTMALAIPQKWVSSRHRCCR